MEGRIHLGSVVEPRWSVPSFTTVVAVSVIHSAVVVIIRWMSFLFSGPLLVKWEVKSARVQKEIKDDGRWGSTLISVAVFLKHKSRAVHSPGPSWRTEPQRNRKMLLNMEEHKVHRGKCRKKTDVETYDN
ncbi:hypothetical protein XENOCAPTIV_011558 [Xenoophorus captivus]|uniref:Transmembrane protein n=1 Tax=Xenoophorus captivus TaxID=1517983 RepID=A0ABV0RGW1_9TELE